MTRSSAPWTTRKKGHKDKKVLLAVTDGEDNASRNTLEKTIREIQKSKRRGLHYRPFQRRRQKESQEGHTRVEGNRRRVRRYRLLPENVEDVHNICEQVAKDIRNQYTLAYYPTNVRKDGTYRAVQVEVIPPRGRGKLSARTRNGYYAPSNPWVPPPAQTDDPAKGRHPERSIAERGISLVYLDRS